MSCSIGFSYILVHAYMYCKRVKADLPGILVYFMAYLLLHNIQSYIQSYICPIVIGHIWYAGPLLK